MVYCVEVTYMGKYLPFSCLCLHFQLKSATDDEGICNIAMGACDVLLECGCTKPLPQLKLDDVSKFIQCSALHSTVLKIKSKVDQFMAGIHKADSFVNSLTAGSIYICTMNRLRIAARSALHMYVKGTSPTLLESAFDTLSPSASGLGHTRTKI